MFKILSIVSFTSILIILSFAQNEEGGGEGEGNSAFLDAIKGVLNQWGEITPEQYQKFFKNFIHGGLHHIWNELNGHCSSNVECGPDACCLKPSFHGKRDTHGIPFSSYCAPLRKAGETCSKHDRSQHYYNFHCPCEQSQKCTGTVVNIHPLIPIQTNSVCR